MSDEITGDENNYPLLIKAEKFATEKHATQVRKFNNLTFISHSIRIAREVLGYSTDDGVIAATVLHDILRKTDTSKQELLELFGEKVTRLVELITSEGESEEERIAKIISPGDEEQINMKQMALLVRLVKIWNNLQDCPHNLTSLEDGGFFRQYMVTAEFVTIRLMKQSRFKLEIPHSIILCKIWNIIQRIRGEYYPESTTRIHTYNISTK